MEAIAQLQTDPQLTAQASQEGQETSEMTHSAPVRPRRKRLRNPAWVKVFLRVLAKCGVVTHAAKVAGVDRSDAYKWFEANGQESRWDDAMQRFADRAEKKYNDHAVDGWEEPLTYKGQLCGYWAVDGKRWVDGPPGEDGKVVKVLVDKDTPGAVWVLATVRKWDHTAMAKVLQWRRYRETTDITLRPGAPSAEDAAALDQMRRDALAQALAQVVPQIASSNQP